MVVRSAASLVVLGDSAEATYLRALADDVGLPTAMPSRRRGAMPAVAWLALDAPEALVAATNLRARGGTVAIFAEPRATDPHDALGLADAGVGLGCLLAWSPALLEAGRQIAALPDLRHLEVRVRSSVDGGDDLGRAVAVAAWCLAERTIDTVEASGVDGMLIHAGAVDALVDVAVSGVPEWSLQAAADDAVVRLELAPELMLERNGEVVSSWDRLADPARAAATATGVAGFADDLRSGRLLRVDRWPAGAHPTWAVEVARLRDAARRSGEAGAPVAPGPSPEL